ncbi:SUMF1/EgtB/PvdO family nonheme iron enzyme [Flagellimonas sp.]|uniref:SUMF1/EgtB/PvdO family nonheme iron enzyme n=1 Tax=Flagellimonas sp. TaxID=2058762 RepID=UPI003AB4FC0F
MRHIKIDIPIQVILLFFAMLISCNDSELDVYQTVEQPTRIGFETTEVTLDVQGTESQNIVALLGSVDQWEVSASDSWLTVAKGSTMENGKEEPTIVMLATENTGYSRTAQVTVTATKDGESISKSFAVVQETALEEPSLEISTNLVNFTAQGGEGTIAILTNQSEWMASTESDWLTLEQDGATLIITAEENSEQESRETEILLAAGLAPYTATAVLLVNQAKPDSEENITVNGIEMVLVRAGSYFQGSQSTEPSSPNYYPDANDNQAPVHQVTITKDFYIGKYEITQAQFESIMGYNPSTTLGTDHPVEMVDWNVATEFAAKLSQETGEQFRLPTEAEWEYAARGGEKSVGYIYSGSNNPVDVAYHFEDGGNQRELGVTVAVGSLAPNELGIHDMSGNVYEWVLDEFQAYTSSPIINPIGVGERKILRGGSWYHNKFSQAVSYRGNNTADFARAYLGFRVIYIP